MQEDKIQVSCCCPHYKQATKEIFTMEGRVMPPCPPDFFQHCCPTPCISPVFESKKNEEETEKEGGKDASKQSPANARNLRSSTSSGNNYVFSRDQMIDECIGCHSVLGCNDIDENTGLCRTCYRAMALDLQGREK